MSVPAVPYDVSYHFDDELREVPNDAGQMRRAVEWWSERLADEELDAATRAELLGLVGVYARILGDLELAERSLREALRGGAADARRGTVLRLRLATVYQWQGRYAQADQLYEEQIQRCVDVPELRSYLDFACQHAGKSSFEQGRYPEAEAFFLQALELRRRKGDAELIRSTKFALEQTRIRRAGLAPRTP